MEKKQAVVIDMAKYNNSEKIHDCCAGCAKVFDHVLRGEGTVTQKCLTYIRPAMWWEKKPVATKPTLVKSQANPKGIMQDLPVKEFRCPVATHVAAAADSKDQGKVRVGQQKQKRG